MEAPSAYTAQARQRLGTAPPTAGESWGPDDIVCDTGLAARRPSEEAEEMDTSSALTRFEAALRNQLGLAGDPAVESAGEALATALRPATRELAFELAQQAAEEVGAQLPDRNVEVMLSEGEPALVVRPAADDAAPSPGDEEYEARVTLRLPPSVKEQVETAAQTAGDSVNRWIVDALAGAARPTTRTGRRVQGRVRT